MERVSLEASKREAGKGKASSLRNNGMIPAVLYGKGVEPITIAVNEKSLELAVRSEAGMNVLFDLNIDGSSKVVSRIREYQADPIDRNFTHVDFQAIDLTQKMVVEVPIVLTGKSKGVKEGGVLVLDRRTLNIRCLPDHIPGKIEIDITDIAIGHSLHINDIKLPEGAECHHDVNFAIVSVVAPQKEEATPAEGAAAPAEGAAAPAAGAAAAPAAGAAAAPAADKAKK